MPAATRPSKPELLCVEPSPEAPLPHEPTEPVALRRRPADRRRTGLRWLRSAAAAEACMRDPLWPTTCTRDSIHNPVSYQVSSTQRGGAGGTCTWPWRTLAGAPCAAYNWFVKVSRRSTRRL